MLFRPLLIATSLALLATPAWAQTFQTGTSRPASGYSNYTPTHVQGWTTYNPSAPQAAPLPQPTYQAGYANGYYTGYQNGYGQHLQQFDRSTRNPRNDGYGHEGYEQDRFDHTSYPRPNDNSPVAGTAPSRPYPAYGYGNYNSTGFSNNYQNSQLNSYRGPVYSGSSYRGSSYGTTSYGRSSNGFRYGPQSSITISR